MKMRIDGIIQFLLTPQTPMWRYCIKAWLLGITPTMAIITIWILTEKAGINKTNISAPWVSSGFEQYAINAVFFAPLLETFMLALFIWIFRHVIAKQWILASLCAVTVACLHLVNSPLNALAVLSPFFVMSCAYIAWRTLSFAHGYWAAALIHFINNAVTIGVIILMGANH